MALFSERFDNLGADGRPCKLGLLGGTFDPLHVAHLAIAEQIMDELELDAVVFVVAGNPVFKRDQNVTDARIRFDMCRAAVLSHPRFDASDLEIRRGGDTFTVDTLQELRAHYPSNVEFYLILGSDAALGLPKWRGSAQIAELAHVAVALRPGSQLAEEGMASILEAGPFKIDCVEVTSLGISSSSIRARVANGQSVRYLVPECVRAAIRENGLYASGADVADSPSGTDADPLSSEFFDARKEELRLRVSAKRFTHIMGVVETCEDLAREYGCDVDKARLAGLLHDWDKAYDDEGARARVAELDMADELDPWVVEHMPQVLHGPTAARALARDYPQIPADVLHAVYVHTTADSDLSDLDKILYIADALEPSRQFGRIDELRALVGNVDLDELFFSTYEYWVYLLFERRRPLHPDTIRIWNDLTAARAAAKGNKRD